MIPLFHISWISETHIYSTFFILTSLKNLFKSSKNINSYKTLLKLYPTPVQNHQNLSFLPKSTISNLIQNSVLPLIQLLIFYIALYSILHFLNPLITHFLAFLMPPIHLFAFLENSYYSLFQHF